MNKSNATDTMIETIGAALQPDSQPDPRWEALALGTLSAAQAEALRLEAPDRYDVYRPFDADEHAKILAGVQAGLRESPAQGRVRRGPWRQRIGGAGVALAFAASLAAMFSVRSVRPLEVAWSDTRGGSPAAAHLSSAPDDAITEVIVPVHAFDGEFAVRGALVVRPGSADPARVRTLALATVPTRSRIIVSGTRASLFPGAESGEWDMVVIVGRPGPALAESEVRSLLDHGSDGEYQVLRKRVVLEGACVGTATRPCREDTP